MILQDNWVQWAATRNGQLDCDSFGWRCFSCIGVCMGLPSLQQPVRMHPHTRLLHCTFWRIIYVLGGN